MRIGQSALGAPLMFAVLASLACGPPAPPSPAPAAVVFQGRSQTAIVKFPAQYDSTRAYPLLVVLHGNGGTAAGFASAFSPLASAPLLVAVPEGAYRVPGAGYSWFYRTEDRGLWTALDTPVVERVVELVADLRARYRIGGVFVLGFSQGASLAYMVGLRNPSLVSGMLSISGFPPEIDMPGSIVHEGDVTAARGVPLFVARGEGDAVIGREVFTLQRDYFASRGYAVTSYEFAGGHFLTRALLDRVRRWVLGRSRP